MTPVWAEIHAFSDVVREKLKETNQLSRNEKSVETVRSYNWTNVERRSVLNYGAGDAISFHKTTNDFARHETVKVIERQKDNLLVERASGEKAVFSPAGESLFDVGYAEKIGLAVGEKLFIRANLPESKLINGEIVQVKEHRPNGSLALIDGRTLLSI